MFTIYSADVTGNPGNCSYPHKHVILDEDNRENLQWLIESSGFPFDYDMLVIDELSSFKNHNSKRFKSLLKVRPSVKRIIGLTGTPSSNGLMDLWAEFRLLDLGKRLGRFITEYRNNYFAPDKRNGQIIYSYKPQPYAEERIYGQISDITISMKSTDHLQMPELISSEYEVHLSEDEVARYEELKSDLVLDLPDGEITAANAASLTGKLSQLANGAIYSDTGEIIEFHDRSSASFRTSGYRKIRWTFELGETMFLTTSGNVKAFWRQPKEMLFITATSRNSSSVLESASIFVRLPLTAGELFRWFRTLKAWALLLFRSVKDLRICLHRQKNS